MTADEFRELALSFRGATEGAHMSHPDFRAHGRIFATLGYPDATRGMVKLASHDQKQFVESHPEAFTPVKGAWGLQGSTSVLLAAAKRDVLAQALDLAWQNSAIAPVTKKAAKKISAKPTKKARTTR
jgi:hypothetical protein